LQKLDSVDAFAFFLLAIGLGLLFWGIVMEPPASINELVAGHYKDWTPGFVIDGALLLELNRVIHNQEKRRVINQVGSQSNEFALDAVRRCREEKWLQNGLMAQANYSKARLSTVDLSDANLAKTDFSFADLSGADLTHANLEGANLMGANLTSADLRWATLTNVNFRWADLQGAQLDGATMQGVKADFASVDPAHTAIAEFESAIKGGFLSPQQVDLVRNSFELLLQKGDHAVLRFYEKLFEKEPQLQSLFSTDINRQARKFLQSLKLIVTSLSAIEKAVPVLKQLGDRHRGYGVKPQHYEVVEATLLATLAELLPEDFNDETRDAWAAAFTLIASVMKSTS
jgi:hemoglobin-like flavoprotein